ncbi:MAG: glutamate-5-semialdehyde dehydrogenase [Candidatus Geothermincolia bacterium]
MTVVEDIGARAKRASYGLGQLSAEVKNRALRAMADALLFHEEAILVENTKDLQAADEAGLSGARKDRLKLTSERIADMADGLRQVAALADPVGEIVEGWRIPNGLEIQKVRVPMGVVGIIYEARPNVTVDAACLCVKSGNAVILRGSSSAINSNIILTRVIAEAGELSGLTPDSIQLIPLTDRESAQELMRLRRYVDVLIPRGGAGLIQTVVEQSTVPVIETGVGNCHTFVDESADFDMALAIAINAKCQRPGVCNAMETLLVHQAVAGEFVPLVCKALAAEGVEIRGDERVRELYPQAARATEEDWYAEFLDLILAMKVVGSVHEAIDHINHYGSHHSEAIITEDYDNARRFLAAVDSADVYVNASTRFTDGNQFGLGAEIGISTQKLHARGPMSLRELTTNKFLIYGSGQIRG